MTALSDAGRKRDFMNGLRLLAEEHSGASSTRQTLPDGLLQVSENGCLIRDSGCGRRGDAAAAQTTRTIFYTCLGISIFIDVQISVGTTAWLIIGSVKQNHSAFFMQTFGIEKSLRR
jgi:hypothetical protein